MTSGTMIRQSLRFYWRTNLGVLLGAAISTAILVGALVVGDSVQYTLKTLALSRLGKVQLAMAPQNRYFSVSLSDSMESALQAFGKILSKKRIEDTTVAPVLQMRGIATNSDGTARVNSVQVLGIDERFWTLGNSEPTFANPSGDEVVVNEQLATRIGVAPGDDILLRVEKTSLLPRDAPMAIGEDFSVALRMTVRAVASDSDFGRFSLRVGQIAPFNAFVPISQLQAKMELSDRANTLLLGGDSSFDLPTVNSALQENWELADADLELRELSEQRVIELRTGRVFLDPQVADAAKRAVPQAVGVLTYFVNELRLGERSTPYSIVTAIGNATDAPVPHYSSLITRHSNNMADDEVVINSWLAEDLQASIGDVIEMTYFVFGSMRKLEERSSSFRIREILPMEGAAIDSELMPVFPGLSDAENCRDWEPGIPVELKKIRDKDEEYWDLYRGTPKAFITLEAGQRIWSNRFGNLTALRYPLRSDFMTVEAVERAIKRELDPASIGLFFLPVREQALAASSQAIDFGQLFLGLSFFLIAAALLLTGLLFVFGIEQRAEEVGTLLALGFPARQVRRLLLSEGGILALLGGLSGAVGGVLYTRTVLYALSTVWRGAVGSPGSMPLYYHAKPLTLVFGTAAGIIVAMLAVFITARRQAKFPARELLSAAGEFGSQSGKRGARAIFGLLVAVISGIAALIILASVDAGREAGSVGAFFGAGALLLIGCLGLSHAILASRALQITRHRIAGMGLRNSARRRWRSLATIGLLACGSFLVIAIGANRHDPLEGAEQRSSGTGGFSLYGESTLPVLDNLLSARGASDLANDVEVVPFRVHDGDDASCLNLNRPQTPRLLGVNPETLQGRFTFTETIDDSVSDNLWSLLAGKVDDDVVNAIADANTISWSVGKSVGDRLMYTDERGRTFYIKIVGAIANSILQGSFIISEDEFIKRFPSESGYRIFLVGGTSSNPANVSEISRTLTRAWQDVGLELTPTAERLAKFNAVENTYLSIFQMLGGLALLLGSCGLGIVVLRNVMERRSELALLRAVGFRKRSLHWMILSEHWLLLFLGLGCGIIAGLVAVLPALRSPGVEVPYISLTLTLFAILFSGALWTWLATRLALRSPLLVALRNE